MIKCGQSAIPSVDQIKVSEGGELGFQLHCSVRGEWLLMAEMTKDFLQDKTIHELWDMTRSGALKLMGNRAAGLCIRCLEEVQNR